MILIAIAVLALTGFSEVRCQIAASTTPAAHHTHHPHHHHNTTGEHNIHHGITFLYDHNAHVFLAKTHNMCYLHNLSDQEKANIHTPAGLKDVELTVFQLMDSPSDTVIDKHDVLTLSHPVQKFCSHVKIVHEV